MDTQELCMSEITRRLLLYYYGSFPHWHINKVRFKRGKEYAHSDSANTSILGKMKDEGLQNGVIKSCV